jgi:ABC-type branched-subunit amino acid transport system permease subunit
LLEHLAPQLINGIVLGAFYAIIAIGLSAIMNLTGTINLAHGSFMTLAGYLAFAIMARGLIFGSHSSEPRFSRRPSASPSSGCSSRGSIRASRSTVYS